MKRHLVHTTIIPQGFTEFIVGRPFQATVPSMLILTLIDQDAIVGQYHKDPFFFQGQDVRDVTVSVDGNDVFTADSTQSLVEAYYKSMKAHESDYFVPYPRYDGKGGFVICVDTDNTSDQTSLTVERHADLSIRLNFKGATTTALKMFVVGMVDRTFTVDHNRDVMIYRV